MNKKNQQKEAQQELENLREQVIAIELKARYWKAQHDVRFYTLAAEKLQPDYDEWQKAQQQMQIEMQDAFQKQIEKMQSEGAEVEAKELEVA